MTERQITIEWCNFSSFSDDYLIDALDQMRHQLQFNYPQLPVPKFSALPNNLVDQLPEYFIAMIPGNANEDSFQQHQAKYIFVLCDEHEAFVQAYQEQNELAHWGVAIPCSFAIAWEPNKYLLWHEALHLMNAKDCYNKFGINKCREPKCIMRRAPSRANCGDQLTLCSKNLKRIQRFATDSACR